ncbi:hypothetical protein M405DRAFT_65914 [Rhizopogon salebrosus TDB-379]|nr:hypothetical protein M405DRAFT_65914 [Rhizopogon salebrosus TDB-379]
MAPAKEQVNQESAGFVSDLLPDLTNILLGRSSHVVASGSFGDIRQCGLLVQPSGVVRVLIAAKTIRFSESDGSAEMSRKAEKLRREPSQTRMYSSIVGSGIQLRTQPCSDLSMGR